MWFLEWQAFLADKLTNNPFFQALMSGVSDEVYLIDATSMRLVDVSARVYKHKSTNLSALQGAGLQQLLGVNEQTLTEILNNHLESAEHSADNSQKVAVNHQYPHLVELIVMLIYADDKHYMMAIKPGSSVKNLTDKALDESESRFQTLVKHSPGLVFQFQLDDLAEISFVYLSERCKALLGVEASVLLQSPQRFFAMINAEDVALLKESIQRSSQDFKMLNWEGRVWIDEWQDTKWVNMRATPRELADGVVQWEGIMTNITQSKNEKHEIEQSRKRLAELSAHLTHAKEEERCRIAREIHDDLGGNLTAIKIGLTSILKRIPPDQPLLIEKAKNLEAIVDNTFDAVHRISGDLRPNILELGIVAALEWQTKEFEKQMGIVSRFSTNHSETKMTGEQAITLFRICQESMSNIAKHANAEHVDVGLFFEPDSIKMLIHDDGVGIAAEDTLKQNSFGLRGMTERVAALNGHFSIGKASDKGTNVTVILPRYTGEEV